MIDPHTGALLLEGDVSLDPSLTPHAFKSSPLGASATPYLFNPPWESLATKATGRDGTPLFLTLYFRAGHLKQIHVKLQVDPKTPEDELKQLHDAWLKRTLGEPPYELPWGSVESSYDPRGDSSDVILTYGKPEP